MKEAILRAEDVCKRFPGADGLVLDHVSLDIYKHDFTVIMGASGAGKSTLLYALSSMDAITSGKVFFEAQEISGLSEGRMAGLRARAFGFVFQQTHLVSNLTLEENVTVAGYASHTRPPHQVRERAANLLATMNVRDARHRMPGQVSGGEAQRAAMARALINEPDMIFCDEPTGALNKRNSEEVLGLLSQVHQSGQSILMVTHDVRAAAHGNRLLYLEDGRIIGEKRLPAFDAAHLQEREASVNEWLAAMSW